MKIEELGAEFRDSVVSLWQRADLARPWNSPTDDFDRALAGTSSVVLGVVQDGVVVATAMVGHDGHRGWVYYLAVDEAHRRRGLGSALMDAAEDWVRKSGIPKIQLMVRAENPTATLFYVDRSYEKSDVAVYGRWL